MWPPLGVFHRRLTSGGIFNNRLLFSGNFCDRQGFDGGEEVMMGDSPVPPPGKTLTLLHETKH